MRSLGSGSSCQKLCLVSMLGQLHVFPKDLAKKYPDPALVEELMTRKVSSLMVSFSLYF